MPIFAGYQRDGAVARWHAEYVPGRAWCGVNTERPGVHRLGAAVLPWPEPRCPACDECVEAQVPVDADTDDADSNAG
jgi:hypothetical protein